MVINSRKTQYETDMKPSLFVIAASTAVYQNITALLVDEAEISLHLFDSGAMLLIAIRMYSPDFLIIELPLADVDGLELYQRVLAHHVEPKTIVVTKQGDMASATRAMRLGAVDVIEKPMSDDGLLRAIANSISRTTL